MAFIHIYTGPDGEAHFKGLDLPLGLQNDVAHLGPYSPQVSQTPKYALPDKVKGVVFGYQTESVPGKHCTPQRHYSICLSGVGEIETGSGEVRHLHAGDVLLDDNLTGSGHFARVAEAPWVWMAIMLAD